MSVAARTRRAVKADPALYDALRDGVVNYSAAARSLNVEGDEESIATALRRFADELDTRQEDQRRVSVRLHRGVALDSTAARGIDFEASGDVTAIEASGDVDPRALEAVLGRLRTAEIGVLQTTLTDESLVVAVEQRAGADALRVTEDALEGPR
ncbi:DUF7523 family protein [Salinarchaeum laminariae]|uniref:DUF7523 family protein n=1 Tax=Salinarchaeum laminariae TaxID=869888 RepID=UPI0020BEF9F1|nr:hypothetical protein [Salinarchaeum laminariae]